MRFLHEPPIRIERATSFRAMNVRRTVKIGTARSLPSFQKMKMKENVTKQHQNIRVPMAERRAHVGSGKFVTESSAHFLDAQSPGAVLS